VVLLHASIFYLVIFDPVKFIFFILCFSVFYSYLGYGLVLGILVKLKSWFFSTQKQVSQLDKTLPTVSFVVCAFNEEDWIEDKIKNTVAVDYPKELIEFVFITDGSNDMTPQLVERFIYPQGVRWRLMHQPERSGKIAAFHRAMQTITSDIVVSTDANTLVNQQAVRVMVKCFEDPQVGAVAGEKRVRMDDTEAAHGAGEGIYWKYESKLKQWDAQLWSVVGAAGELFALRTNLYEAVPKDTIIEDFYLTLRIAMRGHRVMYAPDAYATEGPSASVGEELKRKVRIAAGGIQAIVRLAPLLNPFKYGTLSFQYISHRVLRWTLAPLALPIILLLNIWFVVRGDHWFYTLFLCGQVLFYAAALLGFLLESRSIRLKALFVPYYFCVMNYSVYAGFKRYLKGQQSVIWEKSKRA
jgi:poly-beta-1,6-N-acetyl-D-glucosamine synthase